MNDSQVESCPVCWRDYSQDLPPMQIPCGHSLCKDCCIVLRKCPLCRARYTSAARFVTNYALLSVIERGEARQRRDMHDQCIQTDKVVRQRRQQTVQEQTTVPLQAATGQHKSISVKLKKDRDGVVNCFELKLK